MRVLNSVRLIIYRCHEKGLEVFMIKEAEKTENSLWKLPEGILKSVVKKKGKKYIELSPVDINDEGLIHTIAIEADWHEIPSIRGLIKQDIEMVKHKLIEKVPGLDQGGFFAIKEVFKMALPEEYEALKELKEILADRNLSLNI